MVVWVGEREGREEEEGGRVRGYGMFQCVHSFESIFMSAIQIDYLPVNSKLPGHHNNHDN